MRQDEPFYRLGETFIVVGVGYPTSLSLHLWAGIAHRDAQPALSKHQHIVRHVTERGDLVGRDREEFRQRCNDRSFVGIRMGDVEIVGLRTGR